MSSKINVADEEEVDLDDNYYHFSQLRVNKKVDEVGGKRRLQAVKPEQQQQANLVNKTPDNKTPGTASSCMPKRRISKGEGDKTWSTLMFPDEEFLGEPASTTHNTSSSAISSGSIKIKQLFENKVDLKMKLHVYAIKKKFEFKVKKS